MVLLNTQQTIFVPKHDRPSCECTVVLFCIYNKHPAKGIGIKDEKLCQM